MLRFRTLRFSLAIASIFYLVVLIWFTWKSKDFLPKVTSWEYLTISAANVVIMPAGFLGLVLAQWSALVHESFSSNFTNTSSLSWIRKSIGFFLAANVLQALSMAFTITFLSSKTNAITGNLSFPAIILTFLECNVFWLLAFAIGKFAPRWLAYTLALLLPLSFEAWVFSADPKFHFLKNLAQISTISMIDPLAQDFNVIPQVAAIGVWASLGLVLVGLFLVPRSRKILLTTVTSMICLAIIMLATPALNLQQVISRDSTELACKTVDVQVCIWPETERNLPNLQNLISQKVTSLGNFGLDVPDRVTTELVGRDFEIASPYSNDPSNIAKLVSISAVRPFSCDIPFIPGSKNISTIQAEFALSVLLGADVAKTAPTISLGGEASSAATETYSGLLAAKFLGVFNHDSAYETFMLWRDQISKGCKNE